MALPRIPVTGFVAEFTSISAIWPGLITILHNDAEKHGHKECDRGFTGSN